MDNKDMYIKLINTSNDFKNVAEKLFIIARCDNNISDDDFLEIKEVYYRLKREYEKTIIGKF